MNKTMLALFAVFLCGSSSAFADQMTVTKSCTFKGAYPGDGGVQIDFVTVWPDVVRPSSDANPTVPVTLALVFSNLNNPREFRGSYELQAPVYTEAGGIRYVGKDFAFELVTRGGSVIRGALIAKAQNDGSGIWYSTPGEGLTCTQ